MIPWRTKPRDKEGGRKRERGKTKPLYVCWHLNGGSNKATGPQNPGAVKSKQTNCKDFPTKSNFRIVEDLGWKWEEPQIYARRLKIRDAKAGKKKRILCFYSSYWRLFAKLHMFYYVRGSSDVEGSRINEWIYPAENESLSITSYSITSLQGQFCDRLLFTQTAQSCSTRYETLESACALF